MPVADVLAPTCWVHPVRIGRRAAISSAMKSKKAATAGVRRRSGWARMRQLRVSSGTSSNRRTSSGSASPRAIGIGTTATPDLATETRPSTLLTRAATGALGATSCSHLAARFAGHRTVEADGGMLCEVGDALGAAVAVDVGLARVDRPQRVRDLAADEDVVIGVAGAERDIGIAAREVDVLVAHDELDAQLGVARVEAVEQRRLHDAVDDGLGAGHADEAGLAALDGGLALLEGKRCALDLFGIRQHLLAELGEAVAGGVALHQLASELALKLARCAAARSTG